MLTTKEVVGVFLKPTNLVKLSPVDNNETSQKVKAQSID